MVVANLAAFGFLGFVWAPQWRQRVIAHAIRSSRAPASWWPSSWRRACGRTSCSKGGRWCGEGPADRPLKRAATGVLELTSETTGSVFRAPLDIKGCFSFGDQLVPIGPFRVRVVAPDGSRSRSIRVPEIDPGRHSLYWSF